jgi:hypothetical protein
MNKLVNAVTGENAMTMGSGEWNRLTKEDQCDWNRRAERVQKDALKSKNGINHLRQIVSQELHDFAKVAQIY